MRNKIIVSALLLISTFLMGQQDPLQVNISHNLDENSGNIFDVEVSVSNFENLFSFQLFMKWDSTKFRIDGVPFINEDIPAFARENIVLPAQDENLPTKGKVRMVWFSAGTFSLPNETIIATLRFEAIGEQCEESPFFFEDIGTEESEKLLASVLSGADFVDIGVETTPINIQIPGVNCTSSLTEVIDPASIRVYPNPIIDYINIEMDANTHNNKQLSIFTIAGKLVDKYPLLDNANKIDLSGLQEGTYLYEIKNSDNILKQGKILKVR